MTPRKQRSGPLAITVLVVSVVGLGVLVWAVAAAPRQVLALQTPL